MSETQEKPLVQEPATQVISSGRSVFVRQSSLMRYIATEKRIAQLGREQKALEAEIIQLLQCGAKVQSGIHTAELKMKERTAPAWKEEGIILAEKLFGVGQGEVWASKVQENTESKTRIKLEIK